MTIGQQHPHTRLTRRGMMAGSLAAILPFPALAASPAGKLVALRDTRLWVTELGTGRGIPTLYVHGGPGVGALEFEHYMAPHLAATRTISVDQRGTLRSDPLRPGARPRIADLVADYEALRERLGIERWQLIGHSFGGPIALAYTMAHPARVTRLVLENPACDFPASARSLLTAALPLFEEKKLAAPAAEARRLLATIRSVDADTMNATMRVLGTLGPDRQRIYNASRSTDGFFSRLEASAGLPDARWTQGMQLADALFAEGVILGNSTGDFARLRCPLVMVKGSADHATSADELASAKAAGGRIERIDGAGHFAHVEQPARLAALLAA